MAAAGSGPEAGRCVAAGDRRQELLEAVLASVKACQNRFGQRAELATDTCPEVSSLGDQLEVVLQHGLKSPSSSSLGMTVLRNVKDLVSNNFGATEAAGGVWRGGRTILNKHELERFAGLKSVTTDTGRGRAWLRSALNEQSLEKYFYLLLGDEIRLREFYEDWAFMRDRDRASLLASIASSLCSIRFALKLDTPEINGEEAPSIGSSLSSFLPSSLKQQAESAPGSGDLPDLSNPRVAAELPTEVVIDTSKTRAKKKKKVKGNVVSINDANVIENETASKSAEPVALSSPFHSQDSDTEKLTAKLNNLLKTPDTSKISKASNEVENVDFQYNPVELDKSSNPFDEEDGTVTNPFYDIKTQNDKTASKSSLIPVANKEIGGLFPVSSAQSCLSEDQNNSGDDSMSNPSLGLEDTDYGVQPTSQQSRDSDALNTTGSGSASSLKQDDLKQALLSVMEKKDDLEEQVKALKKLLDQEINHVAETKQELNDLKHINKEKLEKIEAKNSILSRENELLKHQLKKYVGAVQKLRDGPHAYETLAKLEGASQESSKYIDYHYEASEYEKKLIQMAEMHGELLEFSENLQKTLQNKEVTIARLRHELVLLRGPLPEDEERMTEDSGSICSSFEDRGSIGGAARVLVNIWIPSVFLTGAGSSTHHVYQVVSVVMPLVTVRVCSVMTISKVYIRIRDTEWNVFKRYSQFYQLHSSLRKKDPIVNSFEFPPKKSLGNKSERFVEDRRKGLQSYLRSIVNYLVTTNVSLASSPDKETLVTLLPFFADTESGAPNLPLPLPHTAASQNRSLFSRRRSSNTSQPSANLVL